MRLRRELMRNAIGLAYEYAARRLFYSDIQRGAINSVRFDGSDHRVLLDRKYRPGLSFADRLKTDFLATLTFNYLR